MPGIREEFRMSTMTGELESKVALTRTEGMGSREQVEVERWHVASKKYRNLELGHGHQEDGEGQGSGAAN